MRGNSFTVVDMKLTSTESFCSLAIFGCWAFGMLAICTAYGWHLRQALFSVPAFTITAVCLIVVGTKFILDKASDSEPVFEDEIPVPTPTNGDSH